MMYWSRPIRIKKDKPMDQATLLKRCVGVEAAQMVEMDSVVGMGTGSTADFVIKELGRRVREEGLHIVGIPTSFDSDVLARQCGIEIRTLDDVGRVDIAIDGADEVDPQKRLIKGGGAAHTREKIIDGIAERFVVVVDGSKLVDRLGTIFPVPVEVLPLALNPVIRKLAALGGIPELRTGGGKKVGPVITDQGNMVIDVRFDRIDDPGGLESAINNIPGVLDNGLFVDLATDVLVGELGPDGNPIIRRI